MPFLHSQGRRVPPQKFRSDNVGRVADRQIRLAFAALSVRGFRNPYAASQMGQPHRIIQRILPRPEGQGFLRSNG